MDRYCDNSVMDCTEIGPLSSCTPPRVGDASTMKSRLTLALSPALLLTAVMLAPSPASAQYKAPSQYFRKDSPGVNRPGSPSNPGAPGAPGAPASPATPGTPSRPAATEKPKFKDVAVNSQFYFLNDTNRAFPWTKLTATTAKNAKGTVQPIRSDVLIQK